MEGKGSSCAPGAPSVKEENLCEQDGPPELTDQTRIRKFRIKVEEEPPCERGSTSEDALTILYSDHEVKEEIVLGPESLQRASIVHHAAHQPVWPHGPLRECSVRLERRPDIEALARLIHAPTTNTYSPDHDDTGVHVKDLPRRKTIRDILDSLFEENIEDMNTGAARDVLTDADSDDDIVDVEKAATRNSEDQCDGVKAEKDLCAVYNTRSASKSQLMKHLLSPIHIAIKEDCKGGNNGASVNNGCGNDGADEVPASASDCGGQPPRGTDSKQEIHIRKPIREKSHLCEICNKKFSARSRLKSHIETHKILRPQCDVCKKKFRNLENFKVHIRIHTGEKPFSCDICGAKFRLLRVLDSHTLTHTGERPHQCPICEKKFRQRNGLNRHKQLIHQTTHSCEICGKKLRKSDVKGHKRFHMSENNYPCEICETGFMRLATLKEHLMTHSGEKSFSCEICKKTYKQAISLRRHIRFIHTKELSYGSLKSGRKQLRELSSNARAPKTLKDVSSMERDGGNNGADLVAVEGVSESVCYKQPAAARDAQSKKEKVTYSCNICKKRFLKFVTLKAHTRIHTGENPFSCDICRKTFRNEKALDRHKLIHTGERPYQCQLCEKGFRQKTSYRRHKLVHCQPMHSCDICGKKLRKSDVEGHKQFHLSGNKNRCEICEKGFKCLKNLKDHLLIHSGQKPLSCKVCNRSFRHLVSLKRHEWLHLGKQRFSSALLKIHRKKQYQEQLSCNVCKREFTAVKYLKIHKRTHEKSRTCEICNKVLSSFSCLKTHLSTHQSLKPYCCEICKKQFRYLRTLNIHQRIHTGERPFSCDICQKDFICKNSANNHKRLHSGARKFPCDMCEKAFPYIHRLKIHKEVHQSTHCCKICGKTIPKFDKKAHERFHTGDKLYSCEICEMGFARKSVFKEHLLIHSGETPFSCDICSRRFSARGLLTRHKRYHTKKNVKRNVNSDERDLELAVPSSGARAMSPKSMFLGLIRKRSEQHP